jgi:hypothetical protein
MNEKKGNIRKLEENLEVGGWGGCQVVALVTVGSSKPLPPNPCPQTPAPKP